MPPGMPSAPIPMTPSVPPPPTAMGAAVPAPPVRPISTGEISGPDDAQIRAAVFFPSGGEQNKQKFLATLKEMAQKKSKKPILLTSVLEQPSPIAPNMSGDWVRAAKDVRADCFFVLLPPDILADFMETVAAEARKAGLHCFLIPIAEVGSRLLYVDLMVELMLVKKKR